ncbi:MAG: hypothetical protein RIF41_05105 [Polyangiaceae bacterium]
MMLLPRLAFVTLLVGLAPATDAGVPGPPPPSPPRRTAHAGLRGVAPPEVRGHGAFRQVGATVQLALTASDALPGDKHVSLLASAQACKTLDDVGDGARRVGRIRIDDEGRGRLSTRLSGVSIDPSAPNTIIGALLLIHAGDDVEACGRIDADRVGPREAFRRAR